MRLWYAMLELLFPSKCILCEKPLQREETDLCRHCREEAPEFGKGKRSLPFLDSFTAIWYYEGNVRKSLLRYKFGGAQQYASIYGRLLAMKIMEYGLDEVDIMTCIPISPLRKLRRGYDQVALLGKAAGKELGMRPVPLLKKVRHNPAQSGISDAEKRRTNVQGVYRILPGRDIAGKKILLLDDILTTGATAGEAARVLKEAGAKEVHCAVIAAARKE